MVHFTNNALVYKYFVQGFSWKYVPGIGINFLWMNQFKLTNVFLWEPCR